MRLDQVTAGMELSKDVYDPNGGILMRAGVQLTERHIKAFKSWGIQEISIRSTASAPPDAPDPATATEMRELLDARFGLSNLDHPAVQALYQICLERALDRS
jgi:hypothetical protein